MSKKDYIIVKDRHPYISEVLNDCVSLCVPASRNEPLSSILQKMCAKITANTLAAAAATLKFLNTDSIAITQSGQNVSADARISASGGNILEIRPDGMYVPFGGGEGGGTVFDFSAGSLPPVFSTTVTFPTTNPTLTFSLTNQLANRVFIGPASGGAAAPTFRSLVFGDLPDLSGYYIKNQFAGAQSSANWWIDGHARIDDYLQFQTGGRITTDTGGKLAIKNSTTPAIGDQLRALKYTFFAEITDGVLPNGAPLTQSYISASQNDFIDLHATGQVNIYSPMLAFQTSANPILSVGGWYPLILKGADGLVAEYNYLDLYNYNEAGLSAEAKKIRMAFSMNRENGIAISAPANPGTKQRFGYIGVEAIDWSQSAYKGDIVFETVSAAINSGNPTEAVRIKYDSRVLINSLKSGGAVPVTTGTTMMVICDTNGLLSFAGIPSGGGTGTAWALLGNAGTSSSTNFIGTTDSVPLLFRINNVRSGYIGLPATNLTAFGYEAALSSPAGGGSNQAFGAQALKNNTTGENSAFGLGALRDSISGWRNSAFGEYALFQGWGGEHNAAFGTFALETNSGPATGFGSYNTALGSNSLRSNKQGNWNTAAGYFSLLQNTTAIGSIGITNGGTGYTTATVAISAPETGTPGSTSIQATATATISAGVITGITITNRGKGYSNEKSTVTATISGDGSGAVLSVTLISGSANTAFGDASLVFNQIGQKNTAIGYYSGYGIGGNEYTLLDDNCTFIGAHASRDSSVALETKLTNATAIGFESKVSASNNISLGSVALGTKVAIGATSARQKLDVVGSDILVHEHTIGRGAGSIATNVAFGPSVLASNTTGLRNVAIGDSAMYSGTTSYDKTAVGYGAMQYTIGGHWSTGIGAYVLNNPSVNSAGYLTTAVGYKAAYNGGNDGATVVGAYALYNATTSHSFQDDGTTAVGKYSLYNVTTGINNTAVGIASGAGITTGSYNTAFGQAAMGTSYLGVGTAGITGSNNLAFGTNALYSSKTASGNIAIGRSAMYTSTPSIGYNIAIGYFAGNAITTGNYNVIIGGHTGSNIAALSNHILLADGQGTQRLLINNSGSWTIGGSDGPAGYVLTSNGSSAEPTWQAPTGGGGGGGTVTSVSVVTNQGVSGTVATATTTPAITLSLGALTGVTSINGLVITPNTGVITTGTLGTGTAIQRPTMSLGSDATGDIYYRNASGLLTRLGIGLEGDSLKVNFGIPAWVTSEEPIPNTPISSLTSAVTTNNIDNGSYSQQWNWSSTTSGYGLLLSSTSTALTAIGERAVLSVITSSTNSAFNLTTYAAKFSNIRQGASSVNYGIYSESHGGQLTNVGAFFEASTGAGGGTPYAVRLVDGSEGAGKVLTSDASGFASWAAPSNALSSITAAVATNSINNANYYQWWNWDTLTTTTGMEMSSTSLTSGTVIAVNVVSALATGNSQTAFKVSTGGGANVNSNQTTYGAQFSNTHSGTGSTNVTALFTATSGDNNYAIITNGGRVGINNPTPTALLHVGGSGVAGNIDLSGSGSGKISLILQAASGTYNWNWPITAGTAGQVLTSQGGAGTAMTWTTPATALNTITSAVSSNSLSNGNNRQTWNWGTLSSVALDITASSNTASSNGSTLLNISRGGNHVAGGVTSYSAIIENTHTGPSSPVNYALRLRASGATTNIALGIESGEGSVGIGTLTPSQLLHIAGTVQIGTAGTIAGKVLMSGVTSGTITLQTQAVAGIYNFNFPTTAGSAGQILTSQGGGSSAMTWTTPSTGLLFTPGVSSLTYAATIAVDATLGYDYRVTLTGNATMGNPTSPTDGQVIKFKIKQGGSGSYTITWSSKYAFSLSLPEPTLSIDIGAFDIITFSYDLADDKWYCISQSTGFNQSL